MIRADLADQTGAAVASTEEFLPLAASERHRRHGHYPGLILVENNPTLAARLERVLFDDHFEALLLSGEALPVSMLQNQIPAFESAGLIVIYSSGVLDPEGRRKLAELAANRFFDLSALKLPADEREAVQKVLASLRLLRSVANPRD
jgi:hypothetical protein